MSPRPGSLMEARQGLTQGSRGGTVQKAILINGVNSCANIYLFAPSPLEHWLILRILKTEVFIIDIRSNTFKVRSNGNFMCLLLCMCIQPITKMNYASYEKKILHLLSLQPIINSFHHLALVVTEWSTLTTVCYNIYLVLVNIKFHKFYSIASWMNLAQNTATNKIWAFICCGCYIQSFSLYLAVAWHNVTKMALL